MGSGFGKRVERPGVETLLHPCEACHLASDVDNGRAHRVLSTSLMSTNLSTSRVFGVVTVQTGLYLRRFRNDPRVLRFLVSYRSELPKTPTSLLFRPISTRSHPTLGETNTVVIGMTAHCPLYEDRSSAFGEPRVSRWLGSSAFP